MDERTQSTGAGDAPDPVKRRRAKPFWIIRRFGTDTILTLGFLVFTGFYLWHAVQLRGGLMGDTVGPRTFPILIGSISIALAVAYLAQKLILVLSATRELQNNAGDGSFAIAIPPLIPLGLIVAYILLLQPLGYLIATFLFSALLLKTLGELRWTRTIVFSACLTGVSFTLFHILFEIRLPPGFMSFLEI